MSDSRLTTQRSVRLSLVTRPGIAIRLLDGVLREVASGTERLELELAHGLYLVEWSSAGLQSQSMVRIDGSKEIVEVYFNPSDVNSKVALDSRVGGHIAIVDTVNSVLRPSEHNHESSIVLLATGDPEELKQAGHIDLRLYDREEVAMRANHDDAPTLELGTNERAHCYRVRPGRYHIGFRSILNERLGLSVPALAGRQTVVYLTIARTKLIVADGDKFYYEDNVGVDPARTTIVTVRGDEDDYRVRERLRLAGLMLFDLANGTNSLTSDVAKVLDDPMTDPLLKLYGSLVAIATLSRKSAVSPNTTPQSGQLSFFDSPWGERLRKWIGDPAQPGLPTDAIAAAWELHRLFPQAYGELERRKVPSRVEAPPMLECAWRWAIEATVSRPNAVRGSAVVAAARSSGGSLPWLCWQLSAAKARFVPVASSVEDLPALMSRVVEQVTNLIGLDGRRRFVNNLDSLDPDIQATALRAMQLVRPDSKEVSVETVTDMAVALGLPGRLLQKRLVNTSAALDSVAASLVADSADAYLAGIATRSQQQAPGLTRRIVHRNDLQKERFGRNACRQGFVVSAEFKETLSKNWAKVILRVRGPAQDGEEVQFHLHDSFKPPLKTRKFKKRSAKLTVTVWGGFTLGVWIPSRGIELELDMSKLKDAPRIVRDR